MILVTYTIKLWCDSGRVPQNESIMFPMAYSAPTREGAIRAARKAGWIMGKTSHICPLCSGKVKGTSVAREK